MVNYAETFTISSKTSNILVRFDVPINLDIKKNYQVSLSYFTVYNAIKNITSKNNSFSYSTDNGESYKEIKLSEGSYELQNLNDEIQRLTGLDESELTFVPVQYLNRAALKLDNKIIVKFDDHGFGKMLGFNNGTYTNKYNLAQNTPKIQPFEIIAIKSPLINHNYMNDKKENYLYTLPTFTVPVGHKIIEHPNYKQSFPLATTVIDQIKVDIVNEQNELIDFSGEIITLQILIEEALH